jgi:hypothetical protein
MRAAGFIGCLEQDLPERPEGGFRLPERAVIPWLTAVRSLPGMALSKC